MLKGKREVIKHSAAIHIQNNITLLQRRAWNVLLANAYDELPHEEQHRIPVRDLIGVLEFDSNNVEYLKESLKALMTCIVEWNVLSKDKEEWKATTLLAEAGIEKKRKNLESGLEEDVYDCIYAYGPELRRRLHNPRMYARLNLSMQNKFGSKHAQALWELCVDYLDEARSYGETPFLPLVQLKKFIGVGKSYSGEFKTFNRDVIKPAVSEINSVTDFFVEIEHKRESRRIAAVKFKVRRVLEIPDQVIRQRALFPDLEDMPLIVKEMKEAGLSADDAWKIWQQEFDYVRSNKCPEEGDFETYIREKLDLLKRREAEGRVKSSTGFLLKAIKENYGNAEFAEAKQKKARSQQAKEKARRLRQLAKEKEELEEKCSAAMHALAAACIRETPALLETAVEALLEKDLGFQRLYKQDKPATENYQARFIASYVDQYLEQHYPEHFEQTRTGYDARLREIGDPLASLE